MSNSEYSIVVYDARHKSGHVAVKPDQIGSLDEAMDLFDYETRMVSHSLSIDGAAAQARVELVLGGLIIAKANVDYVPAAGVTTGRMLYRDALNARPRLHERTIGDVLVAALSPKRSGGL